MSDYLRGGPRARLADRACTLTVAIWFVLVPCLSVPIGIASELSLGLWLVWAAFMPLMFYLGLREFAGWRCMRRLRHRARR